MREILLDSLTNTAYYGKRLGALCISGDVICLKGDLGAGKTTLTQYIAEGLGIDTGQYITSPTYSLFHHYSGRIPLYHMDFYRLNSSDDVISAGLDEYFYLEGVTVIEWFQNALDIIPENHLHIELITIDEKSRKITCTSNGDAWKKRIDLLVGVA